MSRRSGQSGHIELSGNWFVVRFWKDVPGQETKVHAREKICPVSGPGTMTKVERQRKAKEIIAASGVDTEKHFNEVVGVGLGITFREQAAWWVNHVQTRNRNPVAPSTVETWASCIEKWLNPNIGDAPLASINNATAKALVAKMVRGSLSPKSINNYLQVVKMVVASVLNEQGEEVFPRKWNSEFIDLPMVDKLKQKTPTFTSETVTGLIAATNGQLRMLYILCAATGVRIGEALGIDIKNVSSDRMTIRIHQKAWKGKIQDFLKTKNGWREVDLHPTIAALLNDFIGNRIGLLFCTSKGRPLHQSNILRRSLHPALLAMNHPNAGAHAFRRYRNSWLRRQKAPDNLIQFWLGHGDRNMTDHYDHVGKDVEHRRMVASQVGFGFEISSIVPIVPKVEEEVEVAVVA